MNAYSGKRLLIVTAHPDDESMFFGAVVRELRRRGAEVYVLCLSTGMCCLYCNMAVSCIDFLCNIYAFWHICTYILAQT